MRSEDKVYFMGGKPMTKEELKVAYPPIREKSASSQHYVDGECIITKLSHKKETYSALFYIDNIEIEAVIDLDETEREKLALAWNNGETISLQINVSIRKKTLKGARIVSIGKPRETAEKLSALLE
jgi:hypothetical protein